MWMEWTHPAGGWSWGRSTRSEAAFLFLWI